MSPNVEPVLPTVLKFLTITVCSLGLFFGYILSRQLSGRDSAFISIVSINYSMCIIWFLTPIASQYSLPGPIKISLLRHKTLDQG